MFDYLIKFVLNFGFIFAWMAVFFLPFVAVFWWRHRESIAESKPHFNYFMEQFFVSREANYLVLAWAMLEALVWFIIPEFLLILVIFMRINRKFTLVKYDILGTAIGTIVGLWLTIPQQLLLHVPYIYPRMLDQVHTWYTQHGIFGLVYQPFSGVPYKVFLEQAASFHFFWLWFVLLAIVARISRYVVVYELTKALYPAIHTFVRRHYLILFVFAVAVFTGLLMRVSALYG
jgi:hypothetical protein